MAIQRRVNWISQQRVDVPDMRAVESASSNDFDQLIQAFVTGTSQGYILRGFNILMPGSIGGAANGLQMQVDPGAVLHIASSQSGTVLMVPAGSLPQQLNSATNTIVDGAFAPSAINYVSLEYERFIDDTTSAQVYLWNPTTKNETTKNAPRAVILRYRIKITTSLPLPNYLPVATVITDAGNNVISIQDDRWLLGRLGTGGVTPDPFHVYPWSQGRVENPSSSTSSSIDPFFGGDKAIGSLKEWMDAVMSSLLEVKGTTYWYSQSTSGSIETLREDLGNTVITGKGSMAHGVLPSDKVTPTAPGQLNWDEDVNIRVIGSALTYTLLANPTSTDITLADDEAAYITLVRGVTVAPNLIFTNSLAQVTSVGAVSWTSPLQPGDYLKLGSDTDAGYYQIKSVDSLTQVTLGDPLGASTPYTGVSTGPAGAKGKYAFGTYENVPVPSTSRHIFIADRQDVPEGQDVFWLFLRTDNGSAQAKIYIRLLGTELDEGEDRDISDTTSEEMLKYIGSPHETAFQPKYVAALTPGAVPQITAITTGSAATMASNQYFLISGSGNFRQYAVWVNKDGTGVQPSVPFVNGYIEWDVSTGFTSTQTATALKNALNAAPAGDFLATSGIGTVTVTNTSAGACVSAVNFNVGAPFAIVINQTGTGIGNYALIDNENLTLGIKELDVAMGLIAELLDEPSYDETVDIVASGATPPTSLNGPIAPGTDITLPNNSRMGSLPQKYTVGKGGLEVYLNGQFLRLGQDWTEVGAPGVASDQFQIQMTLVVGDVLEIRIDATGGPGGGGGAPGPQGPPGPTGPPGVDEAGGPVAITTKVADYTVLLGDNVLLADASGGPITFTLPTAASASGRLFYFKKIDATVNAMTIKANGVELIDGFNTQFTTVQYESFTIISNGTTWYIL
ncbi:MAG: hypothetical protein OIN85_00765 [Candidatus Methanoperedens sp.]|nr:hypothetical protein [Candidatus Methanoperedens sp.]